MTAYYNENDPKAAAWLRELIAGGHIADGYVDERSIWDVCPGDLAGFSQCHFFAGIGGWSYALRLAGWPDDRPVWTGSCPCQPFSAAGKGAGFADERHLWPAFFHLIEQCRPGRVYGEQVASALEWLDLVFDDLEGASYTCRAEDLCAAGVGAPHVRQRLLWVADGDQPGLEGRGVLSECADQRPPRQDRMAGRPDPLDGFWRGADWIGCRDGKWRPVEPGSFPMAHRVSDCLANVLSICKVAADRIFEYAERTKADPGETVRMVRGHFHEEEGREAQRSGVRGELYAQAVLFDFMLGQEAACNRAANSSSIQKEIKETVAGAMRIMRVDGGFVQSSHRRKSNEQRFSEPANSLHELSFLLARDTQAFAETVIDAHAAINRVGMLRGYGNAIVPQVAAAFINS